MVKFLVNILDPSPSILVSALSVRAGGNPWGTGWLLSAEPFTQNCLILFQTIPPGSSKDSDDIS